MSLTIQKVAEASLLLTQLVQKDTETPFLPFATKLKISTLSRKLKPDNEKFVTERMKLVQKYGKPVLEKLKEGETRDPQITGYQVTNDCPDKAEFDKLFGELLSDEAELEAVKALPFDSLGENKLSTSFIIQLQDAGLLALPPEELEVAE